MIKSLRKKTEGFTIIEVMIVLAIAALILVVVLIAVPQLQRSQRNSARRDILARVKTELDNYSGNNNGNYPAETNDATNGFTGGFQTRYLSNANTNDPRTGVSVDFANATTVPAMAASGGSTVNYNLGAVCNGEAPNGAGSTRSYAVAISLEGGAAFCLDNR